MAKTSAVKNALGNTSYFQYDAAGQQVATLDARGYPTYFAYDLAGRQEAVTDALGYTGYFWHDAAGRQTAQVGADGSPTYFAYDLLGRQVAVTDALGSSTYYQYDLAGQQVAQADALGYVTYFYYDVLGRQQAVRDAAGGLVYYQYDALGRRVALKDPRGYASYFAYDAVSRLVSELDPLGNATYYQYAADGSLIARTDARGQTAYFEYDAVGRQAMAIYAAVEPVYFSYDLVGNRTRMQDEWEATYWDYDALGRETRRHDPRGTVVTYVYGPGGHRTELTVEGQGTVYYEYGPTGNMDWLLDGKTGLFTYYEYEPAGRVRLQHHPNATATYFVYDPAGRLSEKVTKKDSDASVLVRFAYTRDAAGNPIAIEREPALGAFYYEYDELQRLAYEGQFIGGDREYENYYEYDAAGNRTLLRHGETGAEDLTYYAYDAANELTNLHDSSGWTYFAYDANGNTVMEQTPSYTRYFDWDGRDMLTGVRSTEAGWTDNVYRYDGLASRVSTLESSGLTYYDWDSINVIQEKDADGEVTDRQVHGHAPIFSVGDIALMDKSGTPYVPVSDQPGTTWNLLNSAASKANSYAYDAFGVSRSTSETVGNLYRFGTKRLDAAPALYHFIAREYCPARDAFITRDPDVYAGGQDSYTYAGGGPLSNVDPHGLRGGPFIFRGACKSRAELSWDEIHGHGVTCTDTGKTRGAGKPKKRRRGAPGVVEYGDWEVDIWLEPPADVLGLNTGTCRLRREVIREFALVAVYPQEKECECYYWKSCWISHIYESERWTEWARTNPLEIVVGRERVRQVEWDQGLSYVDPNGSVVCKFRGRLYSGGVAPPSLPSY